MKTQSRQDFLEMMKTVDGPFSAIVDKFGKHTTLTREKTVRADFFHADNEFDAIRFRNFGKKLVTVNACIKCGGTGKVAFDHIENGVCFRCKGTGKERRAA